MKHKVEKDRSPPGIYDKSRIDQTLKLAKNGIADNLNK